MYIFEKRCIVGIVNRWKVILAYVPQTKKIGLAENEL